MLFRIILPVSLLTDITHSTAMASAINNNHGKSSSQVKFQKRCDKVSLFFHQTSQVWRDHDTDGWSDTWWTNHTAEMSKKSFTEIWGTEILRNPGWCLNGRSAGDCAFEPCDISVPTGNEDDLRHAYYMTEAVYRLHSYFDSLSEALQDSSIWAAFTQDQLSLTFDPDDPGPPVAAKAAIIAFGFVVGLLAAGRGVTGALGPAV